MAPSVEPSAGAQQLANNPPNRAIQSDAVRVHQAMNSGLRPLPDESMLDHWIHCGIMAVSVYARDVSAEDGSLSFYDGCLTVLIGIWNKNREALINALNQNPTPSPAASMYLGGGASGGGPAYRGLQPRQHMDWIDSEDHIQGSILMMSLAAWDESIRQNSTQFFDRHFANAIATWNQNSEWGVMALTRAPITGGSVA